MTVDAGVRRRLWGPWHLWPVAIFFTLLYLGGVYDYVMCLLMNTGYFSAQGYGATQVAYFTDYPVIPRIFWTIGIAAGLLAGMLLAAHSRMAPVTALVSVLATVCLDVLTFGLLDRWDVLGSRASAIDLSFLALTIGLAFYCLWSARRGVLR
jgi:hypothetical protein